MEKKIIVLNGRKTSVRDILKALIHLPGYEIAQYFNSKGQTLPAKKVRKIIKSYTDQRLPEFLTQSFIPVDLQEKLKFYHNFTLFQYCNLIQTSAIDVDLKLIRYRLWEYLLESRDRYELTEFDILKLINQAFGYVNKIVEPFVGFYQGLNPCLSDYEGEVDGVDVYVLSEALEKGSSVGEIRNFAKVNNITVPQRISKEQMIAKIESKLKLNPKVSEEISTYSLIRLEQFAKENNLMISSDIKKVDIIEIIYDNFERVTVEKDMEYAREYGGPIPETMNKAQGDEVNNDPTPQANVNPAYSGNIMENLQENAPASNAEVPSAQEINFNQEERIAREADISPLNDAPRQETIKEGKPVAYKGLNEKMYDSGPGFFGIIFRIILFLALVSILLWVIDEFVVKGIITGLYPPYSEYLVFGPKWVYDTIMGLI